MVLSTSFEHHLVVPLGSRVMVLGSLELGTTAHPSGLPASGIIIRELKQWEGPGALILTGQLFDSDDIDATIERHLALFEAIRTFASQPHRSAFFVREQEAGAATIADQLQRFSLSVVEHLELHCTTATGQRRVLVTSTSSQSDVSPEMIEGAPWLEGADYLDEPSALRPFTQSRTLYRRLSKLVWIPPVLAVIVALLSATTLVSNSLKHIAVHAKGHRKDIITEITSANWGERLLVALVAVIVVEAIVGLIATFLARRAFDHATVAPSNSPPDIGTESADPDLIADQDSLDEVRRYLADGGTGVITSGARSPSLLRLDAGFFATLGSSGMIVREHQGRLGLPPVFVAHQQLAFLDVETGADIHVRLSAQDHELQEASFLERLAAGDCVAEIPPHRGAPQLIASWPTGNSWPPASEQTAAFRSERRVKRFAAAALLITGLLDVLVAISPPLRSRLHDILTYLPLGASQAAAAVVAVIGICLVMLARGILRGQRRSWIAAVILLASSIVFHLIHAGSIGAASVSIAVLVLLVVKRGCFSASTDRRSLATAAPALLSVAGVAIVAGFIGVELSDLRHHHPLPAWPLVLVAVAERMIGLSTIALPDHIDDFVYPTMLTVGICLLIATLYLLTRPVVDRRLSDHHGAAQRRIAEARARDIVQRHGRGTLDFFALRDDKQFFFFGDSVVAYAVFGGIALASPDPIGPEQERVQVWAAFKSFCDAHAWTPAVTGAAEAWLEIYTDAGMRHIYLGDEAVVNVQTFSLEGGKMKGLRQANTRVARNGYTVEFLDPAKIDPARVPALVELMEMLRRGEQERGYSMMLGRLFNPKDTGLLLTVVSDPQGHPVAMCHFVPSPAINGFSLDMMRRDPGDHPNGLLDFCLCQTFEYLKAQGATGVSLNFAAFRSILDGERGEGITTKIERWGLKRMSSILPIESLWRFNEKYNPEWLARYLVYAAPEQLLPTAAAALRAESLTEIPLVGRLLASDPSNRPATVVPEELLESSAASPSDD